MRYSREPKYTKYVKGQGFQSFARKFGNKYGKKLVDISKRVVQKTAEATRDLIGKKIADKLLYQAKQKANKKKMKGKKSTYHQKKRQQIIDDLRLF